MLQPTEGGRRGGDMKRLLTLLAAVVALTLSMAQDAPLSLELERFLLEEQEIDGEVETVLLPALELQPGDVLLESLTALNTTAETLEGVALVVPVPHSTAYQAGSAGTLSVGETAIVPEFSFDLGETFGMPPLLRTVVVIEDGVAEEREVEVPPEEYTHVRWLIPSLPPGETVSVSFRALVK